MGSEKRPERTGGGTETVLERKPATKRPKLYRVLLHNDDYTSMEFVVFVLIGVFQKSEGEATHLMLTIHHKGMGVAGVFTRDLAESKVAQVTALAQEHGMPLLCTSEPDE
ncbi:MAG: ATP-dependent Clp protease adaptor ClpS [Myxococcota bacterium]